MLRAAFHASALAFAALAAAGFLFGPFGHLIVSGTSMEPSLRGGDLVLTLERRGYRHGDVVAFRVPSGQTGAGTVVIHRIVGGSAASGYVVRGDNRDHADLWRPRPHDVTGATILRIPFAGLGLAHLRSPLGLALLAGAIAAAFAAGTGGRKNDDAQPDAVGELVLPPPTVDYGWPISSPAWSSTRH
jgi:signal peptidase I